MPFHESWAPTLATRSITNPTAVQDAVWEPFLAGRNLLVQSGTGTGKTLAYLLPLFTRMDRASKNLQGLILAPTQELAVQIQRQMEFLSAGTDLRTLALLGGVNLLRQIDALKAKPHVVVATPGRFLELLEKKKVTGHFITTVVLDEADRLLAESSLDTVRAILKTTLKTRQLALFSASLPPATVALAAQFASDFATIQLDTEVPIPKGIEHWSLTTELQDKNDLLRRLLHSLGAERTLVFLNKPDQIELVASKLRHHGVAAESLYGTRFKEERQKAMKDFASGLAPVLVASDLAARGLDIAGVTHVVHFDIPENPLDYQHRCGRTGRAGKTGVSIALATEYELSRLADIERAFAVNFTAKVLQHGKLR